jgi:predicted porin
VKSNQLPNKVVGLGSFHPNIPLFNFWSLFMMKKTLVAAAALAATGAFAQVTLSGNLDVAFGAQGAIQQQRSNTNSSSAMTFAGTEALNKDLSASFTLVTEIDLQKGQGGSTSTGAATGATGQTYDMWNRAANLALASKSMGTLRLGRQNDAWWETQAQFNTTGSNSFGVGILTATQSNMASTGLVTHGYGSTNATNAGWTGTTFTYVSGVSYATPKLNGFTAKIQQNAADYSLTTGKTVNPGAALSLNFDGGAFKAAVATSSKAGTDGIVGHTLTALGASYTFGQTTINALTNKSTFQNSYANLYTDSTTVGLGVNYRFNPSFDASLSYASLTNDENSANKATVIGVVGRYSLSKRTSVYAGVGTVNNEGTSTQSALWSYSTGATANAVTTSSMLGIRHQF